ncbi:alpha-2-macroglobulin family protein [Alsobacter sp. SYSU BS001988]
MLHLARVLAFSLALSTVGAAWAQSAKSFIRDDLASEAVRLEEQIRKDGAAAAQGKQPDQLRREAATLLGRGDARRALGLLTQALALDPRDAASWLAYARATLATDPKDASERWRLTERATASAYMAYQRAAARPDEAAALAALGEAYGARESWRSALDAYRTSLQIADNAKVRPVYEAMREKYGFRILDYKVDSDSSAPRVCFQFSEALARGKVDFTPFVAVSGSANAAVTADGRQLCVDGLKHGERYAVVLRQGLPSSVEETLLKSADYEIYVRDRSPQVRFTGKNYVLPRVGQEGVPVVSVNTSKVAVAISRIGDRSLLPTVRSEDFLSQIGGTRAKQIADEEGVKIWSGTLDTAMELNRDVVTAFPVAEAVGKLEPGVYVMTARPAGERSDSNDQDDYALRATQWFVVSDLGLTAFSGEDGVHVLVRSLASAEPLGGVELRLVARNNEILATRPTDAFGHVAFDPGLARGQGGLAPSLVVATDSKGDYGFLDLGQAAFDLTDRGVKGRVAPRALDAMLYTERGVYRSGETVNVTALLRDLKGVAMPGLPLTLVAKRPDGVEYKRAVVEDQGLGGRAFSLPLLPGAARGSWRVQAFADPKAPALGEVSFLVEDYVPERIELDLKPRQPSLRSGEPAQIDVAARYLYGAPGAELDVTGEYSIQPLEGPALPGLDGYVVGLQDEPFENVSGEIEDKAVTDARGRAAVTVALPDVAAPRPVQARITLRVGETGGRAVERSVTLPIRPKGPVPAVKKLFGDLAEGAAATFDVVMAGPDGQRLARKGLQWTLQKVERRYQWFNQEGRWNYEAVKSARRIADGAIDVAADQPARLSIPVQWGSYRLDLRGGGEGGDTSVTFTVGWSGDATADTPDMLEVSLDKPAYRAGETMRLKLAPRFAGKATVAVVSDSVRELTVVDVKAGENAVDVPVKADWGAGAYVVALAHRPLDVAAKRLPGRALGVAWFAVDRDARSIGVSLGAPEKMRPRQKLELPIRLAGLSAGEEAYVTVAAVDVGILNLTRYEAPRPFDFFFGQRQMGTEIRDLYGFLIDGMQGVRGAIRSGGDSAALSGDASPPTQEPVSRYSGVVRVGPDGEAKVSFDIPGFNGSVRVMAAAWAKGRVGSATADVIVRDPVVVAGTLPRFLNLGDQSRFFMQIDNVEGPAGDYTIDLDIRGPLAIPAAATRSVVKLEANGRTSVVIPVTATGVGPAGVDLRLTGPGLDATQSFAIRVQPGAGAVYRRIVRPLPPGTSLTVSNDLVADFVPGTASVSLAVSPAGAIDVPALLQALDRYPYGCSEQVVSRAMPLLYVNKLARAEALALDDRTDDRIRDAIDRVLSRQDANGAFGLWSVGGSEDAWLDAYVTDFLTRARERGFAVPQKALDIALDRLRNTVANASEVEQGKGQELAYAIYVLARNGRPVMGDLRYLADTKLNAFGSPLARAQVAAALALLGDRGRAQSAFTSAVDAIRGLRDDRLSRPDYGTRLRDGAGILALAAEASQGRDLLQRASAVVDEARSATTHTSTQENAWMVLAAEGLAKDAETLRLTVDGAPRPGALFRNWKGEALEGRPVTVANAGQVPSQAVITLSGAPSTPEPAASQGYTVERSYYKLDGTKVEPATLRQNDRLVVVLKVTEPEAKYARLLLVDMLPAGLEIDNPKLVDGDALQGLSWLKRDVEPAASEYRDDRFAAAIDRSPDQLAVFSLAYMARAVSPGRFVHPPATVEDMYRPDRFGRTAHGSLEVTAAR